VSKLAAGACALAVTAACQGNDWIIAGELPGEADRGNGHAGAELIGDAGGCPSSPELLAERARASGVPSVAVGHVGRWRGELGGAAAAGFPGVTLQLEIDASGAGSLLFDTVASGRSLDGSADGYLCTAEALGVVCGSASGFVGSFVYPIRGAQSRDGVLSFVIEMADPWGSWCAEHEPVSWEDTRQACGVAYGVQPEGTSRWSELGCTRVSGDTARRVDCASMYALEYCQCARDACFARFDRVVEVGLSSSQDDTLLSGSLWYENGADASWLALGRVP